MTFEGAIRALQRANTQGRAETSPAGALPWAPGSGAGKPATPAHAEHRAMASETAAAPANVEVSLATSAEEFLAAARARIQQRAAARASERPPVASAAPSPPAAPGGEKPNAPASSTAPGRGDLNPSSLAAAIRDVAGEPAAAAQPGPVARTAEPPPEPVRAAAAPPPGRWRRRQARPSRPPPPRHRRETLLRPPTSRPLLDCRKRPPIADPGRCPADRCGRQAVPVGRPCRRAQTRQTASHPASVHPPEAAGPRPEPCLRGAP